MDSNTLNELAGSEPGSVDPVLFLHQLLAHDAQLADRRRNPRYARTIVVKIQPTDEAGKVSGNAFMAITRDLSVDGASLLVNGPVTAPRLVIESAQEGIALHLSLQVLRSRRLTDWCYEVAGQFIK